MTVLHRPERSGEEAQVRAVVEDAFSTDPIVGTLVDRLRDSSDWLDGLSLVAEEDGQIVGHVLFTRGLLDAPQRLVEVLVLSPVSVARRRHGNGIGSALIRYALGELTSRSEPLVFLEGSPTFYGRFGFMPGGQHGFRRPSLRIPEAAFQVYKLSAFEAWMSGTLVYSRVFWDLDCVGLRESQAADPAG
ncbi:MAG: N-acetyltransferase [Chloroflexi bacterium]|nr:N-acetyltransferase [Chloroflexota bacterium]